MNNSTTLNRKIHLRAFGDSGKMLFSIDFEPYFPKKRYYDVVKSLYKNEELTALFGEDVCRLSIEEEKKTVVRGFFEGMTISVYPDESCGKMVEVNPHTVLSNKDERLSVSA